MRRFAVLLLFALVACASPSQAWLPHGSVAVSSSCPQGSGTPGDGCAAANQSATFINASFFTNMRQSGQSAYAVRPPWNVAGVDYPVGQITPDAGLIDVKTAATLPSGCSQNKGSRYIRCPGVTLSGYRFDGYGIFDTTTSVNITDSHFTMTEENCRSYGGSGQVAVQGSGFTGGDHSVTNSTFDFNTGCRMNSDLYHTIYDPGLTQQTTLPDISVATTNPGLQVTINSQITGKLRPGQFLDYTTGNTGHVMMTTLVSPAPVAISAITISGTTATVTTATPHGLLPGAGLQFFNQSPIGYQGLSEVISVPDSTHFTYQIETGNVVPTGSASSSFLGSYSIPYVSGLASVGAVFNVTMSQQADIRGVTISGTTLHYTTRVGSTTVNAGDQVIIPGIAPDTLIVGPTTGSNNYTVTVSQTISTPVDGHTYTYSPAANNVAASTGPVLTNENGPLALASGNNLVTLQYNANLGSGQFSSVGGSLDARWNYEEVVSQGGQHVNFVFNSPGAGTYTQFVEDFNTLAWLHEAEDGGTGTWDYFTTNTSGATNGQAILNYLSLSNNTTIVNTMYNGTYNTNAIIRWLSQGGGVPGNVGTISFQLNAVAGSGIANVTAFTPASGGVGSISVGDYFTCNSSAPACSTSTKVLAQTKGTGGAPCPDVTCTGAVGTYSVTNTVDQVTKTGSAVKYPGQMITVNLNNNYMDKIGLQGTFPYNLDMNVPVTTLTSTGNVLMSNGASCNLTGGC